jgi:glycosyltransferase involved in cell wall biosynthesis
MKRPGFGFFDPLARLGLRLLVGPLRRWDLAASKRPDYFIANSSHIQADIKKYYGRDSVVIFPPVSTKRFSDKKTLQRSGFVTHGRQTGYKKLDVVVDACSRLGLPLTVSGKGPEHDYLIKMAGPTVNFIYASDEALPRYLASADAYLFAAFEDFGIAPIEAMAAGTPVVAYKAGGALDYIIPGVTGEFFTKQTSESLAELLTTFDASAYNHEAIRKHAEQFSELSFVRNMREFLSSTGF